MQHQLQAIVTIVSLVNPAICGAMFALSEAQQAGRARGTDAAKVALTVLVILMAAALGGIKLLHLCGVSLDAFSVAGGGVLAWMGFSMLRGESMLPAASTNAAADATPTDETTADAAAAAAAPSDAKPRDVPPAASSLTPLILFAASPGTITGVITLSIVHSGAELPVTALVAVAVATLILWLSLLLFSRLGNVAGGESGGGSFVRDTVTRFTGLIVIAMGVQFALTGVRSFMLGGGS